MFSYRVLPLILTQLSPPRNSTPTFVFLARAGPTQLNANSTQLKARAKRARAPTQLAATQRQRPRASHCKRHLPLKMHRELICYYLVTTVCRFKVLCLLTPQAFDPSFLRPVISKNQLSAFSFQPPDQCDRIGRPGQFDHQLLAEGRELSADGLELNASRPSQSVRAGRD